MPWKGESSNSALPTRRRSLLEGIISFICRSPFAKQFSPILVGAQYIAPISDAFPLPANNKNASAPGRVFSLHSNGTDLCVSLYNALEWKIYQVLSR